MLIGVDVFKCNVRDTWRPSEDCTGNANIVHTYTASQDADRDTAASFRSKLLSLLSSLVC